MCIVQAQRPRVLNKQNRKELAKLTSQRAGNNCGAIRGLCVQGS